MPLLLFLTSSPFFSHSRAQAAKQLYGPDPAEHSDLVDRTAAVLRNSLLTSTVFAAFASERDSSPQSGKAKGEKSPDTILSSNNGGGGNKLDLSALPSSIRSLLDEKSLSFLLELWRVLNRDEPQTADALLHPNITTTEDEVRSLPGGAMNSTSSGSDGASEAGPTNPLHTSRSDAHGEVLGLSLKPLVIVPPSADGYLVEGWDMAVVTEWIVARVNAVQGFNDQIVIDTLLRGIRPLAELPTPTANGAGSKQASPISKQQQQTSPTSAITAASALSDPTALQSHLDLLIDNGGGKQLVTALIDFLNSPASRTRSRSGSNGNSKAFNKENDPLALPDNVEAWCAADKGLCVALILLEVTEGVLLILQGPNQRGCALLQRPGALGLAPVPDVTSDMLTPLHGAWPCPEGALLLVGDALIVLRGDGTMKKILAIPISLVSLDLSWQESSGLTVVGIFDTSSKYAPQEAAAASGA